MNRADLLLAGVLCCAATAVAHSAEISAIEKSVVRIITVGRDEIGTGSGLVIDDGRVLTNHHVVRNGRVFFAVSKHTAGKRPAQLLWSSAELDLALLAADDLALPAVTVATAQPAKGDAVWALGYPAASDYGTVNLDATVNRGVIGLFHRAPWVNTDSTRAVHIIQHDAAINRGNSGGPLFDDCGRVIGINTQKEADADGVFLALRATEALPELASVGVQASTDASVCEPTAATDAAARTDARLAMQQAQRAHSEARSAGEQAVRAQHEARGARQAAQQTERLLQDTQAAVDRASRQNLLVSLVIAVVAILAVALALRRPRQQLINLVARAPARLGLRRKRTPLRKTAFVLNAARPQGHTLRRQLPWPLLTRHNGGFVLGAKEELVDWLVEDDSVSARHARLFERDRRLEIEDLNTTQGTFINDQRLAPFMPWPLRAGDRLTLGEVTFTVGLNR